MIQRIQTLYLALAAICLALTAVVGFSDYSWVTGGTEHGVVFAINGVTTNPNEVNTFFPYYILIPIIAAVCVVTIFQFKNRKRQMQMCRLLYLLLLTVIVFLFIDVTGLPEKLATEGTDITTGYGIGMFLPVAALPFVFLASRSIKRDEQLIKSVDRLRG